MTPKTKSAPSTTTQRGNHGNNHHPQSQGDIFPRQGISRLKKVCMMTGLSKSTIYAWIKAGKFPAPIKLSPTMTAWRNSDVLDWIDHLEQADDLHTITAHHSPIRQ